MPEKIGACVWLYRPEPTRLRPALKSREHMVRVGPDRDHRFFYFKTEREARSFARRAVAVYRLGVIHGSQVGEVK